MYIPLKIDMPDKFRIELPEKLTVVHLLDLDESKCERLIAASARSIAASARSIAISVGVVLTAIIIIGGVVRYVFTDAHRADAALAAAPAAPEAAMAAAAAEKPLRMAISNICHVRGLFPGSYFNDIFNDKSVPSQVIMLKDLMRKDAESGRMIDWMERGVNDALQNKYLKTLVFYVCEEVGGPMIEEYAFSFSYPNSEITPNQMRSSACKINVLCHLIGALDEMPEERTILMKLLYCDDFTDLNYEPPCFKRWTEEVNSPWTKNPLKMKVANVNCKHLVFDLEVKSVLYGSEVIREVDDSLGASCVKVVASDLEPEVKGESSSQSKRSRKASVVKEPIIHYQCQKPFSFC